MGLQISEIVPRTEIKLEDLSGKVIAVDAFNTIYFCSSKSGQIRYLVSAFFHVELSKLCHLVMAYLPDGLLRIF